MSALLWIVLVVCLFVGVPLLVGMVIALGASSSELPSRFPSTGAQW